MNAEPRSPDDPREWLARANSNLVLARSDAGGIYLEDLCFEAQQAAEKALKAVLIYLKVRFPYVHDLAELVTLVARTGQAVPELVREAARLTRYASVARYPALSEPVTPEERTRAVQIAEEVVRWARTLIGSTGTSPDAP